MCDLDSDEFEAFDFNKEESSATQFADTEVDLQEINIANQVNEKISDDVKYPCIIIAGIETKEEVEFFLNRVGKENALPLYLNYNTYLKKIGTFEVSLDNLLLVRCISNYDVRIYKNNKDYLKLDLYNPEQLIKFITL